MKYESINGFPDKVSGGDEFHGCNFAQAKMHTAITDIKELLFMQCNLQNVETLESGQIDDCLTIHQDIIETVELTEEEMKAKEIDRAIQTLADLAVDSPDIVSEKMAASETMSAIAVSMKPVDIKPVGDMKEVG